MKNAERIAEALSIEVNRLKGVDRIVSLLPYRTVLEPLSIAILGLELLSCPKRCLSIVILVMRVQWYRQFAPKLCQTGMEPHISVH